MGYIRHDAIVVTGWDEKRITKEHVNYGGNAPDCASLKAHNN